MSGLQNWNGAKVIWMFVMSQMESDVHDLDVLILVDSFIHSFIDAFSRR